MIDLHKIEAEQSILGGLMIDNNAIDSIGDIDETVFYTDGHRLIFTAIRRQSISSGAWDVITIAEMLEADGKLHTVGGLAYLGLLAQNVPSSANIGRYSDIVREHAIRRKIMGAVSELTGMIAGRTPVDEAMDKIQSRLLAITETNHDDEPRSIGQIIQAHYDLLEKRLSSERKGITTGLTDLDAILNGGYHRGQVIVLAARTSMGKTAKSMHNAIEAARAGYSVLILSMEMVAAELADRALAAYGRINLGHLLTGKMDESEWGGMTVATGKLHELPLHVIDRSGLNFYQVANYARRHKRKNGLDLLVIDYLQLMTGSNSQDKRHTQIEEITRNMKVLAKELNIAILLLSQLSRKTETSRRPKLSDLRDSGSVEQDADVVLFIHREEVDNPETPWKNYADIHVAKQRQGALGRVGATYIGEQVRFENFAGAKPDWEKAATASSKRGFD